jgi:hypothetical protein
MLSPIQNHFILKLNKPLIPPFSLALFILVPLLVSHCEILPYRGVLGVLARYLPYFGNVYRARKTICNPQVALNYARCAKAGQHDYSGTIAPLDVTLHSFRIVNPII